MGAEHLIARAFAMDDATWRRHANPWSVWTRVASLPLLLGALWTIVPLGWWSVLPIGAVVLWLWLNPRVFPPPRMPDGWASKVTFGERLWLARSTRPVPRHHERWPLVLTAISAMGFAAAVVGAIVHDLFATIGGGLIAWFGKMWFCDRMVWLYEDVARSREDVRSWTQERHR